VAWLKPIRIIPSVSNDGGDKLRKMLQAVTSSGKTSGPMDAWVQGQQQGQQQQRISGQQQQQGRQ
jgi:hypothetical protein